MMLTIDMQVWVHGFGWLNISMPEYSRNLNFKIIEKKQNFLNYESLNICIFLILGLDRMFSNNRLLWMELLIKNL